MTTSVQHRSRRCGATRSYWRRREATAKRRSSWRPTTTTSGSRSRWRRCCTSASRRLNLSATTRRRPCGPTTLTFIRAAGPSRTPSASPRPATCSRRLCHFSASSSGRRPASCIRRYYAIDATPPAQMGPRAAPGRPPAELLLRRRPLLLGLRGVPPCDRLRAPVAALALPRGEAAEADGRARVQALRAGRLLAENDAVKVSRRPRTRRRARAALDELPERARGARLVDARHRGGPVRVRRFLENTIKRTLHND